VPSPRACGCNRGIVANIEGKLEKMNMDTGGKRLGADCGNVKPAKR